MERIGGSLRIIKLFSIGFLFLFAFLCVARAQVPTKVRSVTSLPATCDPGTNNSSADIVSLVSGNTTSQIYFCSAANQWTAVNQGSAGVPSTLPNCTASGTVLNEGVQFSTQVVGGLTQVCGTAATASSQSVVAVCSNNCGSSGNATLVYSGLASAILDGTGVGGDYVVPSSSAGQFTDIGATKPTGTVETFGIVTIPNTGGAGSIAQIYVQPLSLYAPGSGTNGGNVNNAAQHSTAYYSAAGNSNVISGDVCTTDGNGNETCNTLNTNGVGTGTITMLNGSQPSNPSPNNSTIYTTTNGTVDCITNTSNSNCLRSYVDVRVGYGGSGGVDCTGSTDSTTILQTMINNAPDFTKFVFPQGCKVLISTTSGNPTAITIQGRYGLEFWFEGRNTNACDVGNVGNGGARIIDNSSYVSGARIIFINQSQRLLFHDMVIQANGAVDVPLDIDQTTSPPITTQNIFDNLCIQNNAAKNASFDGVRLSHVSSSNIESQQFNNTYVACSNTTATNSTANGNGFDFGPSFNLDVETIKNFVSSGCSIGIKIENGHSYDIPMLMDSSSYWNVLNGGFNTLAFGARTEAANAAFEEANPLGTHVYVANDFSSATYAFDCSNDVQGCGTILAIGNQKDGNTDYTNPTPGGVGGWFGVGNRGLVFNPADYGSVFNIPIGSLTQFAYWPSLYVTNNLGEYLSPQAQTTVSNIVNSSAPLVFESLYNGASPLQEDWILQAMVGRAQTDSTLLVGQMAGEGPFANFGSGGTTQQNVSTMTHWIAYNGNFSGLNLAPIPQPSIYSLSPRNGASSTYSYVVVAHGNNGSSQASAPLTINNGPSTLGSSNAIYVQINYGVGAVYFDVYRTACGGGGICSTNPTGKLGSVVNSCATSALGCNGFVPFVDDGQAGDGTVAPTVNNTGALQMTNCSASGTAANPSVVSCGGANSGAVACSTSASGGTCTVNTALVTANSDILINQRTDTVTGTRLSVTCNTSKDSNSTAPQITAVSAGVSFTFQLGTFNTNPECFNYLIVN